MEKKDTLKGGIDIIISKLSEQDWLGNFSLFFKPHRFAWPGMVYPLGLQSFFSLLHVC